MMESIVKEELVGKRLDQAAAAIFPEYSRSRLQNWIEDGLVTVDGKKSKQRYKVKLGETLQLTPVVEEDHTWQAEDLPLTVVYEDDYLLVVNKDAGVVVHPAAGNWSGTLVNALLFHYPELSNLPRAGIIHRLDKDTTGLLIVARSITAHTALVRQLQEREIGREYTAIVQGVMTAGGTINQPIARHKIDRKRMAVVYGGKPAVTHYRVLEKFPNFTLVKVKLETGRTHQIRVHMAYLHHPILGDQLYGGRFKFPANCDEELRSALHDFRRQALHATTLTLQHPVTNEELICHAPLPDDILNILKLLRENKNNE